MANFGIWAYFVFVSEGGPPKRCGARGNIPPTLSIPPFLTGLITKSSVILKLEFSIWLRFGAGV